MSDGVLGSSGEFKGRAVWRDTGLDSFLKEHQQRTADILKPVISPSTTAMIDQLQATMAPLTQQMSTQVFESLRPALNNISVLNANLSKQLAFTSANLTPALTIFQDSLRAATSTIDIQSLVAPLRVLADSLAEEDLDELVDETWSTHPDLIEEVESEPGYVNLSEQDKAAIKYAAALALAFIVLLTAVVIHQNDELSEAWETLVIAGEVGGGFAIAYRFMKKRMKPVGQIEKAED